MKTIYTFLLILLISISSYAQKETTVNKKTGMLTSGITSDTQTFSINKVYPNPVKDFVTIELQSELSGAVKVSLFNILGSEVKKWDEFFLNEGDQKLKIDLSSIINGVYILKISTSDQVRTQLLKKN